MTYEDFNYYRSHDFSKFLVESLVPEPGTYSQLAQIYYQTVAPFPWTSARIEVDWKQNITVTNHIAITGKMDEYENSYSQKQEISLQQLVQDSELNSPLNSTIKEYHAVLLRASASFCLALPK
jgi:hypothetical protein